MIKSEFLNEVRGMGLKFISDNGSQPDLKFFMREIALLEI